MSGSPPASAASRHDVVDFLEIGESVDLTNCDREPIHLPGAIQPHGVLLAADERELIVRQVSANAGVLLGAEASHLVGISLDCVLGAEPVMRLRAVLDDPHGSGEDPLPITVPAGGVFEATWHRIDGLVILELEPADASGTAAMTTLFKDARRAMDALHAGGGVQALCDVAAAEVKRLTGYDRVMVYRFHPDEHGEVVAEAREPDLEPLLGLHYPASDIPRQARKLYGLKHLGVIADVDYEPVPLLGAAEDAGAAPLNLSFAGLRSVSPLHLEYLRGMGVQATLTISLKRGTGLWGMVTCHHRAPKRVNAQLRAACRLIGQLFSLQLGVEEEHERRAYDVELAEIGAQLVERMSGAGSLSRGLDDAGGLALRLISADGMVASIDGRTTVAGTVPPTEAIEALLARLRAQPDPSALVCDELPNRFIELAPFAEHAAGVLALQLTGDAEDVILWFRGEQIHTVRWGGDPDKPMVGDPGARPSEPGFAQLGPRKSFDAWAQEVRGRCRPWLDAEVAAARKLAAAVPELLLSCARDRLADLAVQDSLTGLPNRFLLLDRVEQALNGPHVKGRRAALLFIDLDRFKLINDTLGHAAGDALLCQAAERLTLATRDGDTVARLGGDEFVVLCDAIVPAQAERLAQRIVQAFQAPFVLDANEAAVTASVGVVIAEIGATAADLLHDADTAMYCAKHGGRNAATPFTPEMRMSAHRHVEIESGLGPALDRGDLRLHYQPIYTTSNALTGFEALARWSIPGRGVIAPNEFIPIAEATGAITRLTTWALDEGLRKLASWRRERAQSDLTLSVNISASQITPALQGVVGDALARHGVPPSALRLEITEVALVNDHEVNRRVLGDLRVLGVHLSIDDFGTGFSSLAYLVQLPVDEIKIDRFFISGLPARQTDTTVVASVVALAHQLGLRAVAEGVETEAQLSAVRRLGCDLVQGYLLGRPTDSDGVDHLLAPLAALEAA